MGILIWRAGIAVMEGKLKCSDKNESVPFGPTALGSHLPGNTELHLIPSGPKAIAVLSIKLLIPALVGV